MPRYIDADALMKEFRDFVRHSNNSDFAPVPTWNDAVSLVGSAPTIEVPDRKVGVWVKNEYNSGWHCSECKEDDFYAYVWNDDTGEYDIPQDLYCPNCGAEMKGEDDD